MSIISGHGAPARRLRQVAAVDGGVPGIDTQTASMWSHVAGLAQPLPAAVHDDGCWRRSMRQTTQTTKKKDERPPTLRCLARVRCRLEWTLMEGLPKSGAQLQGAENGAAYACARGMDGEKKLLHTPPPTALPCCIYYCTTAVDRTAARLSFLPLPLIYTYCYTSTTVPSTTSSPPPPTQPPPPPRSPYLILSPSLPQYSSSNT